MISRQSQPPSLFTILTKWGRIGALGFGGPPAHIRLFRELCVEREVWLEPVEFEDAVAACNLLPGPASTQLAIYCGWRIRGRLGAVIAGLAFILPGLVLILALGALFLSARPPSWISGAAAGASAVVAAVAVQAGMALLPASWHRARASDGGFRWRWIGYLTLGLGFSATSGYWLVLVLIACGIFEISMLRGFHTRGSLSVLPIPLFAVGAITTGVMASLAWVALKVGALSYGGGFVIVPLMQADAVNHHHWMTGGEFLNAVALGQITPGPVLLTVAVVGYAAAGLVGGLFAAAIAFAPSFVIILLGANHFDRLRNNKHARAFLNGAGAATIGAIFGSAIPLARALTVPWQLAVLAIGAVVLLLLKRGVVATLLGAAVIGIVITSIGGALPH